MHIYAALQNRVGALQDKYYRLPLVHLHSVTSKQLRTYLESLSILVYNAAYAFILFIIILSHLIFINSIMER